MWNRAVGLFWKAWPKVVFERIGGAVLSVLFASYWGSPMCTVLVCRRLLGSSISRIFLCSKVLGMLLCIKQQLLGKFLLQDLSMKQANGEITFAGSSYAASCRGSSICSISLCSNLLGEFHLQAIAEVPFAGYSYAAIYWGRSTCRIFSHAASFGGSSICRIFLCSTLLEKLHLQAIAEVPFAGSSYAESRWENHVCGVGLCRKLLGKSYVGSYSAASHCSLMQQAYLFPSAAG